MMRNLSLIFTAYMITYAVNAQDHRNEDWKIFSTRTGKTMALSDLVKEAEKAQVIIFGEEHNDSLGHIKQEQLYQELLQEYGDVSLSLEMFEKDVQLVMDEYLAGLITEAKLKLEGRAWPNYNDYAPLVNMAKNQEQQVIAANVPGRYANMVSRMGLSSLSKLDKEARKYFTEFDPPEENDPYRIKFFEAMGEHGHTMGTDVFYAQLLRDATMAESILKGWRKNRKIKILHLTGKFHSDEGLGTVKQLKHQKKNLSILTISCFPSPDFEDPDWDSHQSKADIIILTNPE